MRREAESWRPATSLKTLQARAELFDSVRAFFSARGVLEVDTPMLSQHATVDRHIESFAVSFPGPASRVPGPDLWLHTSPEFPMKRLLAAGSGPIWQLCHVFRREESGRHHNPEFTMLEWYRPGWDHHRLMDEVEALLRNCAGGLASLKAESFARLSYRDAFSRHAGIDPHRASLAALRGACSIGNVTADDAANRDFWLDLIMSQRVGPALGKAAPEFLFDFPASQAALARIRADEPPVAERFELFWHGIELANGFHELCDADEQARRFDADLAARRERGLATPPSDRHLIDSLRAGLPDCAGVALGIDRLLMLLLGLPDVASTMAFPQDRA